MREYGYLEKMLDILTDPYTHRDLQNVRKNRKLETNIGKLFSLLSDGFEDVSYTHLTLPTIQSL